MSSKKTVNMLEGPILGRILIFSLPIFLGSVFQLFYNMVDSIVVGKYVSADALAAVGSTSTLSMLLVGVMVGFSTGASVVAAQLLGAGKKDKIKPTITTTLIILVVMGLVLSVAGFFLAEVFMKLIQVPDNIFADTVTYFKIYMLGMIFTALYNFYASFLRALGDSTTPLIFLIISSVLNIAGDLYFVIVLNMGVAGVAWATVIAQFISVVCCFIFTGRKWEYFKFRKGDIKFDRSLFKDILRLGLPSGLQSSVTGLGMVFVQGLINSYGSVCIAAYTAASKMEQICNLPMTGISMGLSLFIGQNIGAGNEKRAKKGMFSSAIFSVVMSAIMSGVIILCGRWLMELFVKKEDIEVINVGAEFMKIWAPLIVAHGLFSCVVSFLRGAGDSINSMISMFFDLITRTLMAFFFAKLLNFGFNGIAYSLPCGWCACCIYCLICYFSGGWRKRAVVKHSQSEGEPAQRSNVNAEAIPAPSKEYTPEISYEPNMNEYIEGKLPEENGVAFSSEDIIHPMGYVGIFLLLLVPGLNIILSIIWALGGCRKQSKRHLARAVLIMAVLITLLFIGAVILAGGYGFADLGSIADRFDFKGLVNIIKNAMP